MEVSEAPHPAHRHNAAGERAALDERVDQVVGDSPDDRLRRLQASRLERLEAKVPLRLVLRRIRLDHRHAGFIQPLAVLGADVDRSVGIDQGDVGGIAAQEDRFAGPAVGIAEYSDLLVGDLIAVADRAIAD